MERSSSKSSNPLLCDSEDETPCPQDNEQQQHQQKHRQQQKLGGPLKKSRIDTPEGSRATGALRVSAANCSSSSSPSAAAAASVKHNGSAAATAAEAAAATAATGPSPAAVPAAAAAATAAAAAAADGRFTGAVVQDGDLVVLRDFAGKRSLLRARLNAEQQGTPSAFSFNEGLLVGAPYGSTFSWGGHRWLRTQRHPSIPEGDNRGIVDSGAAQRLTAGEIERLKGAASAAEVIREVAANSATFEQRTAFSKQKYIIKKAKRQAAAAAAAAVTAAAAAAVCASY
ncbi:hypothetical protein, conserved [Eimeria acervulina]|uniref:tRNA (adenine(58)-N(1))-methyltransferase non-catalytic subunit TRM6 n=1 Tax=Eimeria acervulina TaxID=5801 RepID=U6G7E1_EIMAC|nr:hypothetical protein, conserved [Eimeria acervulina]CDI76080.1 hypothetical protein, conserved [Eimeria acervulina]